MSGELPACPSRPAVFRSSVFACEARSSARRAANRRDLTVPPGMPSRAAISATGSSSRWRRTSSVRSSAVRRSKARSKVSAEAARSASGPVRARAVRQITDRVVGLAARVLDRDLAHAASLAQRHPAGVDDDPPEPCLEAVGIAQPGHRAPCRDERLLDGVLRVGVVAQDGECGPVHGVHLQPDERLECGAIAPAGPLDELSLHRPSCWPHMGSIADRVCGSIDRSRRSSGARVGPRTRSVRRSLAGHGGAVPGGPDHLRALPVHDAGRRPRVELLACDGRGEVEHEVPAGDSTCQPAG